ncbi:CD9 antigen-like [Hemiscyllium ocellatum]|uniref:CD9 antigen-like n=1 Tax=Hemiscyllium ocellatum TaxID=170820 RepID=UPI0029668085|nr:CD9 antigen-like [Hemiscyllium ocellatum]
MVVIQARCIKYCLLILNLIFALLGLIILLLAFWFRFDERTKSLYEVGANGEKLIIGIYVMWAAGGLLLVSGFTGYFAVTKESKCLLWFYLVLIVILFLIEMTVAIWAFAQKDVVIEQLQDAYAGTIDLDKQDDVDFKCMINALHKTLDCCGYKSKSGQIRGCDSSKFKDCLERIEHIINSKLHIFAAVAFGIALITVFGIIFTILLYRSIKRSADII